MYCSKKNRNYVDRWKTRLYSAIKSSQCVLAQVTLSMPKSQIPATQSDGVTIIMTMTQVFFKISFNFEWIFETIYTFSLGESESSDDYYTLKQVRLPFFNNGKYRQMHAKFNDTVDSSMICVGDNRKAMCYGDSGGPLMAKHADGKWYQHGVISWSHRVFGPSRRTERLRQSELLLRFYQGNNR